MVSTSLRPLRLCVRYWQSLPETPGTARCKLLCGPSSIRGQSPLSAFDLYHMPWLMFTSSAQQTHRPQRTPRPMRKDLPNRPSGVPGYQARRGLGPKRQRRKCLYHHRQHRQSTGTRLCCPRLHSRPECSSRLPPDDSNCRCISHPPFSANSDPKAVSPVKVQLVTVGDESQLYVPPP